MGVEKHYLTKKQKESLNRVNMTCIGISGGLSYNEIQHNIQSLPSEYGDAKGKCSVDNVKRIVQSVSSKFLITEVIETKRNSFEDAIKKHDLEIISGKENIGLIGVQVKSSIYGVLDFYKSFDKDYEKAKEIVINKKIIVLNGQLPDEIISRNFLDQFRQICNHCGAQNNI